VGRTGADQEQSRHLSSEEIAAFISGKVSSRKRNSIIDHLAKCRDCRKIAAKTVASQKAVRDPGRKPPS
jgi:hypothetical protein